MVFPHAYPSNERKKKTTYDNSTSLKATGAEETVKLWGLGQKENGFIGRREAVILKHDRIPANICCNSRDV